MKSVWKVYAKKADFEAMKEKYHIDPVLARIIRNRDVISDEEVGVYLNGDLESLNNPHLLKDADKTVSYLLRAIESREKIRIIGDYDIDGVCSIYILLTGLKRVGADVDYVIPHRVNDGYGINEHLIQDAREEGITTILTCDNGIAAIEQVEYARKLGMTVLITDHHELQYTEMEDGTRNYIVPEADAIVNPRQPDCEYPFKGICGAVVAWKVVTCLYEKLGISREEHMEFLKYAAIATVGDVMVLQGENRIIVREGLRQLNATDNLALSMLMEVNGIARGTLTAFHIGFVLGPCLNASGRLDTARHSMELLCADNRKDAERLAGDLKAYNDERKNLTAENVRKAMDIIENGPQKEDNVLVVYLADCHESIAGIIAGRLREHYYRPVLVITDGEDGLKGSGRSIEGYHMFEELLKCKHLLTKFGGHPMAAGLSMPRENLGELRRQLNANARLTEKELTPVTWIDAPMPIDYITENFVSQLSLLEPFGNGNSKPVFADRNLRVSRLAVIGRNKNVLRCLLTNERGFSIPAVMFGGEEIKNPPFQNGNLLSVIYYPSINEYAGRRSLQIVLSEVRVTGTAS